MPSKGLTYDETIRIVILTEIDTAFLTLIANILFHWYIQFEFKELPLLK